MSDLDLEGESLEVLTIVMREEYNVGVDKLLLYRRRRNWIVGGVREKPLARCCFIGPAADA